MGMQNFGAPAGRNMVEAGKISVGKPSASMKAPQEAQVKAGGGITGFGGSSGSGVTAANQSKSPKGAGAAVAGFSGSGTLAGKIK